MSQENNDKNTNSVNNETANNPSIDPLQWPVVDTGGDEETKEFRKSVEKILADFKTSKEIENQLQYDVAFEEDEEKFILNVQRIKIQTIRWDNRLTIMLSNKLQIILEGDFIFYNSHEIYHADAQLFSSLPPFQSLEGKAINIIKAYKTGTLEINFEDGSYLKAEPQESYEAWQILTKVGNRIVCMPGGELAIWY